MTVLELVKQLLKLNRKYGKTLEVNMRYEGYVTTSVNTVYYEDSSIILDEENQKERNK